MNNPLKQEHGRSAYAYAKDVNEMISDTKQIEVIGADLRNYEAVIGIKINREKSVGQQLGTWRGRSMSANCVKLLAV